MHSGLFALYIIYAICAPLSFECGAHILKNLRNAPRRQRVLCSHADDETEKKNAFHFGKRADKARRYTQHNSDIA